MLLKQLEDLLKLSLQWVTVFLTLAYRIHQGKFNKKTGDLAIVTLLLFLVVWVEGTKLWVMTAYRCYELGKKLGDRLNSSPVQQVTIQARTETVEKTEPNNFNNLEKSTSSQPLLLSLHSMSSKALKQLARERRIKGYGSMTKAQLVAALS